MKKYLTTVLSVLLVACGGPADNVKTEKVTAGKILGVGEIQSSNGVQFGPVVSTSTGLIVFFQNTTPVKIGTEAILVTNKYKSGMITRQLCYEDICAELRG